LKDEYLTDKAASYKTQYRILRKDGSFIWVHDQAFIMERDAQGNTSRVLGMLEDITHLKSDEERIKEQKDQIDFTSEIAGFSYWELGIVNRTILFKGRWHRIGSRRLQNEEISLYAAISPDVYFWSQVVIQIVERGKKGRPIRALGPVLTLTKSNESRSNFMRPSY
jgi:hypothetical protein